MAAKSKKTDKKKTIPPFRAGDTIRVHLKVVEGESERIQVFEGVVIRRKGGGVSETFTVRKVSFGVGVERVFPLHSPRIHQIELARGGRARRARLYYLRKLGGRAARLTEEERSTEPAEKAPETAKDDGGSSPPPEAAQENPKAEAAPA